MQTTPNGVLSPKTRLDRKLERVRELFLTAMLVLTCSSCAYFAVGGAGNPIGLDSYDSLSMKAGSTMHASVSVAATGRPVSLGGNLARQYRDRTNSISFDGSNSVWVAGMDSARLAGASLPGGWSLNVGGSAVELNASSSTTEGSDELTTVTRVSVGSYRVNVNLSVPGGTKPGSYKVGASINSSNGSIRLNWNVKVE
jgi:hypothetical protein